MKYRIECRSEQLIMKKTEPFYLYCLDKNPEIVETHNSIFIVKFLAVNVFSLFVGADFFLIFFFVCTLLLLNILNDKHNYFVKYQLSYFIAFLDLCSGRHFVCSKKTVVFFTYNKPNYFESRFRYILKHKTINLRRTISFSFFIKLSP